MSEYLIYGKRIKPFTTKKGKVLGPDKQFRALDARGVRVSRLADAMSYATKEDAQEIIDRTLKQRDDVTFEIRRAYS